MNLLTRFLCAADLALLSANCTSQQAAVPQSTLDTDLAALIQLYQGT